MICLSCHVLTGGRLCDICRASLRPAAERLLPGGIRLVASFDHEGVARRLVHLLKYRAITDYAELAADILATKVPPLPLVPLPRAVTRRLKYGIDPACILAEALARRQGVPVVPALVPRVHSPRRAGRDHGKAVRPPRARALAYPVVAIVDDVVTTGATMTAAIHALGPNRVGIALAANSVSGVSRLSPP